MPEILLRTKLSVPPLRASLVPRPHLIERLDQGLQLGHKLTLVSAPAGFGKTTLVCEWLGNLRLDTAKESQSNNRCAWLSLDEGDNDPTRFLVYFVTALKQVEGIETTFGDSTLSMLRSPQPPPTKVILSSLINEVSDIPCKIVLVLDDYVDGTEFYAHWGGCGWLYPNDVDGDGESPEDDLIAAGVAAGQFDSINLLWAHNNGIITPCAPVSPPALHTS